MRQEKHTRRFAVDEIDKLRESLVERGVKITEDDVLSGVRRFYAEDPWGKAGIFGRPGLKRNARACG